MSANVDLTTGLRALPEISAPPDLAATVLARIARIEAPAMAKGKSVSSRARARSGVSDWLAWTILATSSAALTIVLIAYVPTVAMSKLGTWSTLKPMQFLTDIAPVSAPVAACLVLYLVGLFGPITRRLA